MDWWDLLAVQGTLKSLLQHHSSKASILQRSAFFLFYFILFFFKFYFIFKVYITVLVLPNIKMNPPQVYISFLYSPTLTTIHDYWKNHSFDYMDLCQQRNVSTF